MSKSTKMTVDSVAPAREWHEPETEAERLAWRDAFFQEAQPETEAEFMVGRHDAALDACHWFSLAHVRPDEAALLLCGFNPHKDGALDEARRVSTSDTTPDDFRRAVRVFEDAQSAAPAARRTLLQWIGLAEEKGLRRDRWVTEYIEASPVLASPAAPVVRPVPRQVSHAETILSALRGEGFDPLQLPPAPAGKASAAKSAARKATNLSPAVFDKAWQALRREGRIADRP